ncbi:hypothetical protein MUK42_17561 [Musa troglodytarum]|uniref:PH domain-containing protein n=1 Tax=Musa troglodytarum TaxID=320322 RepID=A0A9E7H1H1_9LILI|nr:hypothetical protein MUK42_17561 [Musa troglodytarum]
MRRCDINLLLEGELQALETSISGMYQKIFVFSRLLQQYLKRWAFPKSIAMTAISQSPRDVSFNFGVTCSDSYLIFSISKEEEYSDWAKALLRSSGS